MTSDLQGASARSDMPTCRGTRKDGEQCKSRIVLTDGFCAIHSPTSPVDPVEQGRRGGKKSVETRREQSKSVRDRLRERVEEEFERVWLAFDGALDSEDERVRVAAAQAVLAEAYGRPTQAIVGDGDKPLTFVLESAFGRTHTVSTEPIDGSVGLVLEASADSLSVDAGGE